MLVIVAATDVVPGCPCLPSHLLLQCWGAMAVMFAVVSACLAHFPLRSLQPGIECTQAQAPPRPKGFQDLSAEGTPEMVRVLL